MVRFVAVNGTISVSPYISWYELGHWQSFYFYLHSNIYNTNEDNIYIHLYKVEFCLFNLYNSVYIDSTTYIQDKFGISRYQN